MSHRCGANCRRKRGLRSECETCNRYKESRRKTIVAGGKRRLMTRHFQTDLRDKIRPEVTRESVAYVLDNWAVRGIDTSKGRDGTVYLAFVPAVNKGIRVVVSMDDKSIVSAYPDSKAAKKLRDGNYAYYARKFRQMEVRNETDRPV